MITPTGPDDPALIGPFRVTARVGAAGDHLGEDDDGRQVVISVGGSAVPGLRVRCGPEVIAEDPTADPPFVAVAHIDGPDLYAAVREGGPLTGSALDRLAVAAATALASLHRAGAAHGRLVPAAVVLGPDGPRITGRGDGDGRSAPAADVFAWGELVAFAARGRSAFTGPAAIAVPSRLQTSTPELDGLPTALRPLVAASLHDDPTQRPTSTGLLSALLGAAESDPALLDAGAAAADDPTTRLSAAPTDRIQVVEGRERPVIPEPPALPEHRSRTAAPEEPHSGPRSTGRVVAAESAHHHDPSPMTPRRRREALLGDAAADGRSGTGAERTAAFSSTPDAGAARRGNRPRADTRSSREQRRNRILLGVAGAWLAAMAGFAGWAGLSRDQARLAPESASPAVPEESSVDGGGGAAVAQDGGEAVMPPQPAPSPSPSAAPSPSASGTGGPDDDESEDDKDGDGGGDGGSGGGGSEDPGSPPDPPEEPEEPEEPTDPPEEPEEPTDPPTDPPPTGGTGEPTGPAPSVSGSA